MNLRDAFRRDQILLITSYFSPGSDWNWIYGVGPFLDEKLDVTAKGKKKKKKHGVFQTSL